MKNAHRGVWASALAVVLLAAPGAATAAPHELPVNMACRDVPEAESHLAVLVSAADVLWVAPLKSGQKLPDASVAEGDGVRITISSRPFTSATWLQSVIDCHFARNALMGSALPVTKSPLDVLGATARVTSTPGLLIVDVTSRDKKAAREIIIRSRNLLPPV